MLRRLSESADLTKSEMQSPEKELIVEEYKACRDLIGRNIEIVERNEVYIVGACAAIFAFSTEKGNSLLTFGAAWLPLVLAFIGKVRYDALHLTISKIDDYLRDRETHFKVISFSHFYLERLPEGRLP